MEHLRPKTLTLRRYPILCSQCRSTMKALKRVTQVPLISTGEPAYHAICLTILTLRPSIAKAALLSNHSMSRIGSASIPNRNSFLTLTILTSISTETIKPTQTPSTPSVFPILPSRSALQIPPFTRRPPINALVAHRISQFITSNIINVSPVAVTALSTPTAGSASTTRG